jgi:hypothetical protein
MLRPFSLFQKPRNAATSQSGSCATRFASFALPAYQNIVLRTREAALPDDLYTLRSMIDRFNPQITQIPQMERAPAGSHGQGFF